MKSLLIERIGHRSGSLRVFAVLIGLAALVTCLAPRASVPMLALLALSALPALLRGPDAERVGSRASFGFKDPLIVSALVLLLYLALNALWALDGSAAFSKVAAAAAIAAALWLANCALRRMEPAMVYLGATLLIVAVCLGAAFLATELVSGQHLKRFALNMVPALRPESAKDLTLSDGLVVRIAAYELNRNLALLIMMLWPALLVVMRHPSIQMPRWLAGALFMLVALTAFFSEHETSAIAIAFSALVFLISLYWSTGVQRGLVAVWCLGFLLAIPIAQLAYHSVELHKAPWLPATGQARIILWAYTAEKVSENPLAGIGIRSTRVLDAEQAPRAEQPEGHVFGRRSGRHAHNIFLQSWYELGLIGAALVMVFGLSVLGKISALPDGIRPYGHALFASILVFASLAWGMWQTWLLSGYALAAIYFLLAGRFAETRGELEPART